MRRVFPMSDIESAQLKWFGTLVENRNRKFHSQFVIVTFNLVASSNLESGYETEGSQNPTDNVLLGSSG
ncbi:uncharacterized protein EI90DRAFT_3057991 [Cantharellus anzutake]|uniref:uncharacterized protein n=1 Tax=Cantharellus anzutake TaxID=1750568 RepID=UPI0019076421|nr:uncharacterized protein EI90DRAFT_3057991 [Cantharellus anzutake]KAF8331456.1 hypothetical protein EI90DRAFT_3057991 [Cantharellus anzutake]